MGQWDEGESQVELPSGDARYSSLARKRERDASLLNAAARVMDFPRGYIRGAVEQGLVKADCWGFSISRFARVSLCCSLVLYLLFTCQLYRHARRIFMVGQIGWCVVSITAECEITFSWG